MLDSKATWSQDSGRIPREVFSNESIYQEEQERIFRGPTWHLVAHDSEVPSVGDYKRTTIADVPIFIVRGPDNVVRGFVNACAHRGAEIVNQKRGNAGRSIGCIYHGWRYELSGKLQGVWLPNEFPINFKKEDHSLTGVRVETFHGCIFVTLSNEADSLEQFLGERIKELFSEALGSRELTYLGSQTTMFRANWKLCIENVFDSYHPQVLHGAVRILRTRLSPDSGFDVAYSDDGKYPHAWTRYRAQPIEEKNKDVLNDYSLFEIQDPGRQTPFSTVIGLFCGDILSCQLDVLQLRYVRSRGVDSTEIEFANFGIKGEDDTLTKHRVHQANILGPAGVISLEDGCALERVQWSASAGGVNHVLRGSLPDRPPHRYTEEGAVKDFYRAYRAMMAGKV